MRHVKRFALGITALVAAAFFAGGAASAPTARTGAHITVHPAAMDAFACKRYYKNVSGNCVHRPSSDPAGATARCSDGTYSYSQHASGTCSHHGGVATWIHHP
jgi:hypothetical protein